MCFRRRNVAEAAALGAEGAAGGHDQRHPPGTGRGRRGRRPAHPAGPPRSVAPPTFLHRRVFLFFF